ncbi:MAG: diguanylate cyclase [Rhodocyclales bacterium]|nr:diguanylate cyclase [Rhodocyclales bacterium]
MNFDARLSGQNKPTVPSLGGRRYRVRTVLAWVVVGCLLPGMIAAWVLFIREYVEGRAQLEKATIATARALSLAVDSHLLRGMAAAQALSIAVPVARQDVAAFHQRARGVLALSQAGDIVVLSDATGQQLVNTLREFGEPLPRHGNMEVLERVFATGKPIISDIYLGGVLRKPVMSIDVPVIQGGKVAYDVSLGMMSNRFNDILLGQGLPAGWVAGIFDSTGTLAGRLPSPEKFVGQKGTAEFIQRIKEAPEGAMETISREGIPTLSAWSRSSATGWSVGIGIPRAELENNLRQTLVALVGGFLLLLILGLTLAWMAAKRIAGSARELAASAIALGAGERVAVPTTNITEAAEVGEAIGRASELLSERAAELEKERAYLELRVQERTADLARSTKRLSDAQRIAMIGDWELNHVHNTLTWSDEIFHIFEIDQGKVGASYDAYLAAIHPDDRERVSQAYEASAKNRLPYEISYRLLLPSGTIKYVRECCETSYAPDGKPLRSNATVQDVTMSRLAEESLKESEERFRTVADYTYDWEYWQGPQGEILYISPSCQRITGYSQADFISHPHLLYDIIATEDRHVMDRHLADTRQEHEGNLDFRIVRKDGGIRWIAQGCRAVYANDGRFLGRRASNRDITDRKIIEEQVQQLAYFDTLTGLPNRRMLFDRLERALTQAKRFERSLAIMFLDLDNFKKINDTLGHDAGDELLKEVAVRLEACIRSGDTVARQGGDEFIIVLAEIAESRDAALVAEKIVAILTSNPVRIAGQSLEVTTSIGIAVYSVNSSDDARELLKKADKAMYAAKAAGRNGYRFFED